MCIDRVGLWGRSRWFVALLSQISCKVSRSQRAGPVGESGAVVAGFFTSLSYQFRRWAPGYDRTYQRTRAKFHWRGLYWIVQRNVDGETSIGWSRCSLGNVQETYPFQILAMDHILSLPRSFTEIRELLIKIDLISKYVVSKASASRTAQIIAQNYIEWLFRWFGSSEAIRQDRKPGFISDFVRALIRIVGHNSKQLWRIDHKHTAQRNLGYRRWPERSRCMCQSRNQNIGMNVPNDWHTRLGLHMIESAGTLHFFIYN